MANLRRGRTIIPGPTLQMGGGILRSKTAPHSHGSSGGSGGPVDASVITYTPFDGTDWIVPPGLVNDAFDELADRVTALETGGGGAPDDAQYLVGASDATLTAERVVTNTPTVTWDLSTAGQAKANAVTGAGGGGGAIADASFVFFMGSLGA